MFWVEIRLKISFHEFFSLDLKRTTGKEKKNFFLNNNQTSYPTQKYTKQCSRRYQEEKNQGTGTNNIYL